MRDSPAAATRSVQEGPATVPHPWLGRAPANRRDAGWSWSRRVVGESRGASAAPQWLHPRALTWVLVGSPSPGGCPPNRFEASTPQRSRRGKGRVGGSREGRANGKEELVFRPLWASLRRAIWFACMAVGIGGLRAGERLGCVEAGSDHEWLVGVAVGRVAGGCCPVLRASLAVGVIAGVETGKDLHGSRGGMLEVVLALVPEMVRCARRFLSSVCHPLTPTARWCILCCNPHTGRDHHTAWCTCRRAPCEPTRMCLSQAGCLHP